MRIGLIAGSFLPLVGGLEWKVHFLASEYQRLGHEAVVFAGRPYMTLAPVPMPVPVDYEVIRCGQPFRGVERSGIAQWLFRRAVVRAHRRSPFDVLHCHHLGFPAYCGALVKSVTGLPVVATTTGDDVMNDPATGYGYRCTPARARRVAASLERLDVVVAVSTAIRDELETMQPKARIVSIPNGVAWEDFQGPTTRSLRAQLNLSDDNLLVLTVGRNHSVKGCPLGVEAFAAVAAKYPTAHYALVGRDTSALEPQIRQLGLTGRVHAVEQLPMDRMPDVFRSADIFFNPSTSEGFAQVNVQAMASGLPLLVTDAPGNVDVGKHGAAIVAQNKSIASMADGLDQLLGDPGRREVLALAARAASREYSWQTIAGRYLDLFAELSGRTAMSGSARPAATRITTTQTG